LDFCNGLFFGGYASSKKYEDLNLLAYDSPNKLNKTEYIVIERGAFAATINYYHERHNLFLMKKKESYLQVIFPTVILQSALRYSQCSLLVQSEQRPVPSY